jgi:predicted outer membrane repeat protein
MTVRDCRFDNNTADSDGGAILVKAGTLSVSDSVFIGNHANKGGGIQSIDSTVTIRRCTFQDNIGLDATSLGGGVATYQATAWIERCRFIGNSAGEHGGGLWGDRSSMFIVGCAFSENSARWGAATSIYMSTADIANCVFSSNHCAIANASVNDCGAGAINSNSNGDGDVRVVNCTMVGNVALVSSLPVAGAIILNDTKDIYRNCIFWDNHIEASRLYGHVLRILSNAAMRLDHSLFDGTFTGYWVVSVDYLIDLGGNLTGEPTAGFFDDADPDGPDNLPGSADDGLHLLSTSPATGTGLSSALEELGTTPERLDALNIDAAGEPRTPGGSINMGAYQTTVPAGSS